MMLRWIYDVALDLLIVGRFYSEVALQNEKQKARCIINTSIYICVCVCVCVNRA